MISSLLMFWSVFEADVEHEHAERDESREQSFFNTLLDKSGVCGLVSGTCQHLP